MGAVVIKAGPRTCALMPEQVAELAARLRRYSDKTGDPAWGLAIVLEQAADDEERREVEFQPGESADLLGVLNEMRAERAPLAGELECVRDGLMVDAGMI